MTLERRPITFRDVKRFIGEHHRHNLPPTGWLFGSTLWDGDELRAVGVASRPTGRGLQDGATMEVSRVCTIGDRNACSMLYGALCRAGGALGYWRAYTYTLVEEDGASVRAAGFVFDAEVPARDAEPHGDGARYQTDLFGNDIRPPGAKNRWIRVLGARPAHLTVEENAA